jgi:hypothetical protein
VIARPWPGAGCATPRRRCPAVCEVCANRGFIDMTSHLRANRRCRVVCPGPGGHVWGRGTQQRDGPVNRPVRRTGSPVRRRKTLLVTRCSCRPTHKGGTRWHPSARPAYSTRRRAAAVPRWARGPPRRTRTVWEVCGECTAAAGALGPGGRGDGACFMGIRVRVTVPRTPSRARVVPPAATAPSSPRRCRPPTARGWPGGTPRRPSASRRCAGAGPPTCGGPRPGPAADPPGPGPS